MDLYTIYWVLKHNMGQEKFQSPKSLSYVKIKLGHNNKCDQCSCREWNEVDNSLKNMTIHLQVFM